MKSKKEIKGKETKISSGAIRKPAPLTAIKSPKSIRIGNQTRPVTSKFNVSPRYKTFTFETPKPKVKH